MKVVRGYSAAVKLGVVVLGCQLAMSGFAQDVGKTEVMKWKDGKVGVFMMGFDDSCVTHLENAIPALVKRGYPGTFYINPGNGPFQSRKNDWMEKVPKMKGIVYGNHTYKHKGATDAAMLDEELLGWQTAMAPVYASRKKPFLLSFAQPGGVKWEVSKEEQEAALKKYNLINRPPFWGGGIHVKTTQQMEELIDKAVTKGMMTHLDFHGVGGDWLKVEMDFFNAMLDKLDAEKDKLWVADHISYHKYLTERTSAKVEVVKKDSNQIRIKLTSDEDPALYDEPLTLRTQVPANWAVCKVTQGKAVIEERAEHGVLQYNAVPGAGEIVITKK